VLLPSWKCSFLEGKHTCPKNTNTPNKLIFSAAQVKVLRLMALLLPVPFEAVIFIKCGYVGMRWTTFAGVIVL